MANTLKFGNGNWATQKGSVLAYNDENNNFKPLPFDFTRASTATYVDSDGLIKNAGKGEARIDYTDNTKGALLLQPARTNLIARSESFASSYWTKSSASIEGDASTAGSEQVLNGDFATDADWTKGTGWTISGGKANAASATSFLNQTSTVKIGKMYKFTYTVSNYSAGAVSINLGGYLYGTTRNSNGTFTEFLTISNPSANTKIYLVALTGFTGSIDNVSVKEVQGFSAPSADTPLGAFKLVEGTGVNTYHQIYKGNVFTPVLNNYYTFSFFAKPAERTVINGVLQTYNIIDVKFDLIAKTATVISGLNATGTIKEHSNGWFKCTVSGQSSQVLGAYANIQLNNGSNNVYDGDGTSGAYIFGAQIELGSYATSYIPTQGSTVTRLADSCSQTPTAGIIGQTEGTIFAYVNFVGVTEAITNQIFFVREQGSNNGYIFAGFYQGKLNCGLRVGGTSLFDTFFSGVLTKGRYKIAIAYKSGDTKIYVNGVQTGFQNNSFGVTNFAQVFLTGSAGTNQLGDINREFKLYNTRLSDSELEALTTL